MVCRKFGRERIQVPLIISDDEAVVINDVILEDAPAVIITGDNVRLTNRRPDRSSSMPTATAPTRRSASRR
jgi:hypothetical protein